MRWIARENSEFCRLQTQYSSSGSGRTCLTWPLPLLHTPCWCLCQSSPGVLSAFCPSLCPEVLCGDFCPQNRHKQSRQKCCYLFPQISLNVSERVNLYWPFLWPKCQIWMSHFIYLSPCHGDVTFIHCHAFLWQLIPTKGGFASHSLPGSQHCSCPLEMIPGRDHTFYLLE